MGNVDNRICSIDAVKGFAIFAVVIGHVIANFFESWSDTINETPIAMFWWQFVYSFHMPLMMFLSGYLFLSSRVQKDNIIHVWWHKAQPLVLPFVTMGVVVYLLRNQKDSYWYLRTLLEFITIQLIYEYIRSKWKLGLKSDIVFLLVSCFLVTRYLGIFYAVSCFDLIVDIGHIQWVWFYFNAGVLFRRYQLFQRIRNVSHLDSLLLLVLVIYCCFTVGQTGGGTFRQYLALFNQPFILCGLTSFFIAFEKYNPSSLIMKVFQYLGQHTLEIYLLHLFFLLKICFVGNYIIELCNMTVQTGTMQYQLTALTIEILLAVTLSIVNVALCAAIYEPLKAFPLVYRLFLGRKLIN